MNVDGTSTGAEHYEAAQKWLRWAEELYQNSALTDGAAAPIAAAIAQVHATLALTATNAALAYPEHDGLPEWRAGYGQGRDDEAAAADLDPRAVGTDGKYICVEPGCERGRESGHALYRTSPKGELFEGKCAEHFEGVPDPLVQAIEDRNQVRRGADGE